MYEQVEIVSGVLPDAPADSIGGSLNLKTRSTFSMGEKRRINYSVGARWAPPFFYRLPERAHRDIHPSFSFLFNRGAGPSFYRYTPERVREIRFMPSAITFGVNGQF